MPANIVKKRIVLLGCGYTSVWCYKFIEKHAGSLLDKGEAEIVLLSDTDYHSFHGFIGEFLNGSLSLDFQSTPYQEAMSKANYIQGRVVGINQITNEVAYQMPGISSVYKLSYDELVVGIGSYDNEETVAGIAQWGLGVKKAGALQQCRERILYSLEMASLVKTEAERNKYLTFTVIGGGFAAVELSANLQEYLEKLKEHFTVLKEWGYKLYLISPSEDLIPQVDRSYRMMKRYTKNVINKLGITVLANQRLAEVTEDKIILQSGTQIPTIVPICALGQKVLAIKSEVPFELAPDGRIVADEQLRAKGFSNIWVGGDIAHVQRPYFTGVCRKDALWAVKHGSRIGKNIARKLKGKQPGKFAYPGLGQTAAFGKNKAILEMYGIQFIGILAWISRIGFFLYFMPSRKKALAAFFGLFRKRELFPAGKAEAILKNQKPATSGSTCEINFH